jgi:sugar lactone lactonase YvrE
MVACALFLFASAFLMLVRRALKALWVGGAAAFSVCLLAGSPAGAQTAHFSGVTVNLTGGYYEPAGVALDAGGNVFFTGTDPETENIGVYEIVAASGYTTVNQLASNYAFSQPGALAVDASGNVFTSDLASGTVYEILAPQYTTVKVLPSINSQSSGIAVDKNGNVFVSYLYKNSVNEIPAPGYTTITVPLGNSATNDFNQPAGLAVDGNGDLFVADSVNGQVKEMVAVNGSIPANATVNIVGSGFTYPHGVALDAYGNLYVTDGIVKELLAVNGSIPSGASGVTLGSGFSDPDGVAVDASGNVFVADDGNNAVYEVETGRGNFGSVNVGSTSASAMPLTFTFDTAGTLGSTTVLTQGATGLDFTDAGSDTCTAGTVYNAGNTCTVNVKFSPQFPGPRYGSVELLSTTGALLATGYVQGTGVGPNVTFAMNASGTLQPAAQFSVGSGFSAPAGVAVDASRNIFVADFLTNKVQEITAASALTSVVTLATGFSYPNNLVVDGSGNIFLGDPGDSAVKEIVAAGGYTTIHTLGSGFNTPSGVAVDGRGNVYVADYSTKDVYEMLAVNGTIPASPTIRILASELGEPDGVAVDGSGNVFVANLVGGTVQEIVAVNGVIPSVPTINTIGTGFNNPYDVVVDGSGNVYVANFDGGMVQEMVADSGYSTVLTLGGGFMTPAAVGLDAHGNVLVADLNNHAVDFLDFEDAPSPTFADTEVSFTSSDSPQTITVTNLGNAPLVFAKPTTGTSPSVPAGFTWDTSSTCQQTTPSSPAPFQLAGGASCTMALDFAPTTTGSISGFLQWTDNALNSAGNQEAIQLVGNGTAGPLVTFSATSLSFGSVTVGQASGSQTVTLTNTGSAALQISSIVYGGGDSSSFVFGNSCGASLAVGANCSIQGHFAPTTGGPLMSSLVITDNAGNSPQTITFSGTGLAPDLIFGPPTLPNFPATNVGQTSSPQTLAVVNLGPGTLLLSNIAITGANANQFKLSNPCGTTVASDTSCILNVSFAPTQAGTAVANISFTDNAAGSPQTMALNGTGVVTPATMTSPAPGSTLTGSTVTFNWTTGAGVTQYDLHVGTTGAGSSNIFGGTVTGQSKSLTGIPTTGGTLNVRLYSFISGAWQYIDYTYTEINVPVPATMTSPMPDSTLTSSSATFTWTVGNLVTQYDLHVGTTGAGSSNIFGGAVTGQSKTVTGIPTSGGTLNVRVLSLIHGAWQYNDYVYTESNAVPAAMTSPTPGGILAGSAVAFAWTAGTEVTQYDLHIGTTGAGSSNIFAGTVAGQSKSVTGIPTTGGTLNVRLLSLINGVWQYADYTYTEATAAPATLTSPPPGSTLTGSSATITWTTGSLVTEYDLHVGTTGAGSSNIFGGTVTGQSKSVTGIPTTGGTLNVRLYSLIGGVWQYVDYTYKEQ